MKKKNGQIRYCVDFRNLNKACPKDEFPLPNIDLLVDSAAGAMYQRTMTAIFHHMMHEEMKDYVDDIVVKSKTRTGHLRVLEQVFERCRKYKLCMNPMKCAFKVSAGKFLGFLVHHKGISVDPAKATAIATMKRSTTVRELKSFLGRVFYIRRFVPRLASVRTSLSKLLKKETEFT